MPSVLSPRHLKHAPSYFTNFERSLLGLTHELSGPLTAARLNLDSYSVRGNPASLRSLSDNLKLMEDYLLTARQQIKQQVVPAKPFSVNKQLADIIRNLAPLASARDVSILMRVVRDCRLRGNSTLFKQIISCFLRNAIDAYDNCEHYPKKVTIRHHHEPGYLIISIKDHGSGISDANRDNIFVPYYSTKNSPGGLGLGLSLAAESIKEEFKGDVRLEPDKSIGTEFSLCFSLPSHIDVLK